MQMQQLTAGRGALTAVRTGAGRDLVVLHSLLADRHAFDPVLPALAAQHRVTLGCTTTLSPALSLSTLATALADVWLSVPGCIVAKP